VFEMFEISRRANFFNNNKKIARLLSEYSENLIRLSSREIQMVILFGSVSRGEWTKRSDIDVLTVTAFETDRKNIIQVHEKAKDTAATLLNISAVNVSLNKFTEGIRNRLEFYEEVWRDRIILYNEFLFWQLIKKVKLVND
jgi:predicted nucleotidyltransferase